MTERNLAEEKPPRKTKRRGHHVKPGDKIGGGKLGSGKRKLNIHETRQRAFAKAYITCWNAKEALKIAGIQSRSPSSLAWSYMRRPLVQKIIQEEQRRSASKAKLTTERVMLEIASMAFTVMHDFAGWTSHHVALVPSSELTRDQGRCIQSVEETKDGRVKIKLYDKTKMIALAAQVLKMIGVDAAGVGVSPSDYAALVRKAVARPLSEMPTKESDRAVLQPCVGTREGAK